MINEYSPLLTWMPAAVYSPPPMGGTRDDSIRVFNCRTNMIMISHQTIGHHPNILRHNTTVFEKVNRSIDVRVVCEYMFPFCLGS